jgi:CRISPR-associated exonuclease Cas4
VEFWPDGEVYPVEYKHGPRRVWLNDDIQLAAQANCLEEMLSVRIESAAIFHAGSKRRREVAITDALRAEVEGAVPSIREMIASRRLPAPVADTRRCRECSLKDICQPEAARALHGASVHRRALFDPEAL